MMTMKEFEECLHITGKKSWDLKSSYDIFSFSLTFQNGDHIRIVASSWERIYELLPAELRKQQVEIEPDMIVEVKCGK